MPIVTSTIVEDHAQIDGRRAIRERHVDELGVPHEVSYLGESATDANAAMTARVARIESQLKQNEIDANIAKALNGETDTFTFRWSTANENLAAVRELYRTSTRWELLTIAHVLHHQNLSDAQVRNLFGVNQAGVATVRAKLLGFDTKYHDILDDAGE